MQTFIDEMNYWTGGTYADTELAMSQNWYFRDEDFERSGPGYPRRGDISGNSNGIILVSRGESFNEISFQKAWSIDKYYNLRIAWKLDVLPDPIPTPPYSNPGNDPSFQIECALYTKSVFSPSLQWQWGRRPALPSDPSNYNRLQGFNAQPPYTRFSADITGFTQSKNQFMFWYDGSGWCFGQASGLGSYIAPTSGVMNPNNYTLLAKYTTSNDPEGYDTFSLHCNYINYSSPDGTIFAAVDYVYAEYEPNVLVPDTFGSLVSYPPTVTGTTDRSSSNFSPPGTH